MSLLTNLVSYWKLDGNSNDAHGANPGTDTAITYSAGKIGSAASGNGTTSKIDLGAANLDLTGALSISLWIFRVASGNYIFLFSRTSGGAPGAYELLIDASGRLTMYPGPSLISSGVISTAAWTHVVITRDVTTANNRMYLNGVLDAGPFNGGAPGSLPTAHTYIGTRDDFFTLLNGTLIDEVGVWSRELTAGEVTQLFAAGAGLAYPFSPPATLVSIAVTPSPASVAQGQSQQLTAIGTYSDTSTADLTATAAWSSSSPATVTVGSTGLARGVVDGSAVVTATASGVSGSTTVVVKTKFLRLNGIEVPVALGDAQLAPETIGKMRRSGAGSATAGRRLRKGGWKFTTVIQVAAEALAFRELLAGEGHVLSFDNSNWYTSQGMAPVSIGASWAFTGTGPKFGSMCASSGTDNSVWQFFAAGLPLTIAYWLNAGGAGYHHYLYASDGVSLGKAWVDGAGGFGFADCVGLVSVTGGAITLGRASGTSKWDDVVALPYQVPDSWPPQIYGFGSAFGLLPALTADGLYIEQNSKVSVLGGDAPTARLVASQAVRNLHDFSFELSEV